MEIVSRNPNPSERGLNQQSDNKNVSIRKMAPHASLLVCQLLSLISSGVRNRKLVAITNWWQTKFKFNGFLTQVRVGLTYSARN
jgi:hypothetical protein